MSSINGVGGNSPIQRVTPPAADPSAAPASTTTPSRRADSVDLSGASYPIQSLNSTNVRADKVASVKAQIASGGYETDQKLNVTADRLLDDLLK